jgi:tetratricopeptide (TPR) repeat protein
MSEEGPNKRDLDALKDGALMLLQAGNRVAALSLLWSAVAIDPIDLPAHRRLAAALANAGDLDGAASEFARYIEFMLPLDQVERAVLELQYGAHILGGHPALRDAAEKIATAVRALVPSSLPALAPAAAAAAIEPEIFGFLAVEPLPAPRLLPKVPFRFCLHPGTDRHWMQLEGGAPGLVPDAVRMIDASEKVIEERWCMPLAPGQGHAPKAKDAADALTWVVVAMPNEGAAAIDAELKWDYTFQARVNDEWLALDLVDSGCRLGRSRATASVS